VRINPTVILLSFESWPLQGPSLDYRRDTMPPQHGGRVVGVVQALAGPILQASDSSLDLGNDLGTFAHYAVTR
jgi:hypothetical protein